MYKYWLIVISMSSLILYFGDASSNSEIPKFMLENFFSTLIHGAKAVTAEDPKEQIRETAEVLQNISNIVQLAFNSSEKRITQEEYDIICKITEKLYKACIKNALFIEYLNNNKELIISELEAILKKKQEIVV